MYAARATEINVQTETIDAEVQDILGNSGLV